MATKGSNILVSASILAGDQAKLEEEARRAEAAGADFLHVDVMDGKFVPPTTYSPEVVSRIKAATKLPLDVHLMINEPWKRVGEYAKAGADWLSFHSEAGGEEKLLEGLELAKKAGAEKTGISINPPTPVSKVGRKVLEKSNFILVMTVNPGYAGQKFIESVVPKIGALHGMFPGKTIAVDGGITPKTAVPCAAAGATFFVAGASIYRSPHPGRAVEELRAAAAKAIGKK